MAGWPDHEKAVTTPSPARNAAPPSGPTEMPVPASDLAPTKTAGAVRLKPDTTETRALAPVGLTPDTIGDDAFAAVVSGFSRTTAVVSGFSRTTGRSIADVSNPSLAATSAAADSSPAVGFSGSTMRAFTKSTAPSPLRSWNTTPGLKNSDNDTAGSPGAVRPNAPKLIMTRQTRKSLFMSITRMCRTYEPVKKSPGGLS